MTRAVLVLAAWLALAPSVRVSAQDGEEAALPPSEETPATPSEETPATPSEDTPATPSDEPAEALAVPVVEPAPVVVAPVEPVEIPPGARRAPPAPVPPSGPPSFDGRAYPARYARRPLTIGEGVLRIDSGSSGRFNARIGAVLAFGLHLGVTPNLEVGFSWAIFRDPMLQATYRFDVDPNVDLGLRASVRLPIVTTGNTVLRVGVPLVVRGGDWFRLQTGVDLDLLFEANVSPLFEVPLQIAFSPMDIGAFGFEGWLGIVDGTEIHGRVGTFATVVGRTPLRALWDVRFAFAYLIGENAAEFGSAVSFYPQLW